MRPCSPRSADDPGSRSAAGFTLVEALVASVVSLAIVIAAMTLALAGRRIYEADGARIRLNEGIRVGKTFLVTDLRQAGERLPKDFPAIEIIDGPSGAPDTLVVRRNLLDTVLRSCRKLENSDNDIHVAEKENTPVPPGCSEVADNDADGWPDNIQEWRAYRLAQGGAIRGYVYDPIADVGEFFDIKEEKKDGNKLRIVVQSPNWANTYEIANQCRVYVLEERRYSLAGGTFQVVIDGDGANPTHIAEHLIDFQVVANFAGGVQVTSLGPGANWSTLETIGVLIEGDAATSDNTITRTWTSNIVPRNVLSE